MTEKSVNECYMDFMISYATCVTCCLYYLPCDSHKVNQNQYVEGLYSNI